MSSIPYYLYAAIMMDSATEATHLAGLFPHDLQHYYAIPAGLISNRLYPIRSNRDGFFWMQLSDRPTRYQIANMFQMFIKEAHPWRMFFVVTNLHDQKHAHLNTYSRSAVDGFYCYEYVELENAFVLPSRLVETPFAIATQMDDFSQRSRVIEHRFFPIEYPPINKLYDRQEILI